MCNNVQNKTPLNFRSTIIKTNRPREISKVKAVNKLYTEMSVKKTSLGREVTDYSQTFTNMSVSSASTPSGMRLFLHLQINITLSLRRGLTALISPPLSCIRVPTRLPY